MRKLLEQALDALERSLSWISSHDAANEVQDAIEALRIELAKPEQEPVAWRYDLVTCNDDLVKNCFTMDYSETTECHNIRPLYAAPVECKCLQLVPSPRGFIQQPSIDGTVRTPVDWSAA